MCTLITKCKLSLCSIKSLTSFNHKRLISNALFSKKRNVLFETEQKRQKKLFVDVEKIEVKYIGQPEESLLIMNKNISTPYNCLQHISNLIMARSVLAEVNGELWDVHRPLEEDCTLNFLHFQEADPFHANRAFWRSCSIMLGAVLENTFKDELFVELCSFPAPNVRTGSFVYDIALPITSWTPNKTELRALSSGMVKLALNQHCFERLQVDASVALKIFEDNQFKTSQIPQIASASISGNDVVLYRVGDFVDISRGPLIGNTNFLGRCTIAAVLPLEVDKPGFYRVQGVALPSVTRLNAFSYGLLEARASNLNEGRLPNIEVTAPIVSQQV